MKEFYEHVEKCQQCTDHPLALCPVGQKLIDDEAAATQKKLLGINAP